MTSTEQIRTLVTNWAKAIQEKDWDGIMAAHHNDIVMYDVPPPFQSIGVEAYRKTWEDFLFALVEGAHSFQVCDLQIIAGEEVAFCYSPMKCIYHDKREGKIELDFRLTIGFRKIDGRWWFMHEHHSIPATT
jgi:uncharacterized protein (TIGR02246 family)